jgi:hypothetical protein
MTLGGQSCKGKLFLEKLEEKIVAYKYLSLDELNNN